MDYVCNDCSFYSEGEHEMILHLNSFCHSNSRFKDGFNKTCNIDNSGVLENHVLSQWELNKTNDNTMEHSSCACNNIFEKEVEHINNNHNYDVSKALSNLNINKM
ncbi:Hypothetical protein SRAE_1000040500 [Strongyloides ratti]|uniref:Zinc finger, C2H2 domain-containing protein n=1 Tax=Strongyloides ratti TaxID=34506 RepID=A0A090KXI9_STRRB|nr:Hypothetical protein SRAE_1000040500 [Strongyloides ratti]CEF62131.1 Hypothetical protein SRAE_1000040500 [Strongyloides ratti]